MPQSSLDRETKILDLLHKNGKASIQDLVEAFDVSNMTIHRDLNKLEEAGVFQKKHGGVVLAERAKSAASSCDMCGKPVSERTMFLLNLETGEQKRACCSHCGLMIQSRSEQTWQSMTVDFLHGHMVSANQAFYLMGSDISVCCVPSILSFSSQQDAEKFQKGFGGMLVTMEQAIHHLKGMMQAHMKA